MKYFMMALAMMISACATGEKVKVAHPIETQEVTYRADGKNMVGYVARPKDLKGPLPAVLVVHEWWGQTDYPRKRAEMLAELGYVAMAVDMFGDRQLADHPKTAGGFTSAVMKDGKTVASRFNPALATVRGLPGVDSERVAAVGYCFGGSVVLEMAKQGAPLVAVASFHGGLNTPTKVQPGKVNARLAVFNGASDPMVKSEDIKNFEESMKAAQVDFLLKNYEGALHGFTNPQATENGKKFGLPLAYDVSADKKSWAELQVFLNNSFK